MQSLFRLNRDLPWRCYSTSILYHKIVNTGVHNREKAMKN